MVAGIRDRIELVEIINGMHVTFEAFPETYRFLGMGNGLKVPLFIFLQN